MISILDLQYQLEAKAKELLKMAEYAKGAAELFNRATDTEIVQARLDADARVLELTKELERAQEDIKSLQGVNTGQSKQLRTIRENLNAKGRNPIADHAFAVFEALKEANPQHHLVVRKAKDVGEKARLSMTDAKFLYVCLEVCAERMGRMGCNDWIINDPSPEVLNFAQRVEDYTAADNKDHEHRKLDPKRVEGTNFMVPHYLQSILREVYGEELKSLNPEDFGL